jgi:histidinol-phosphatase (PHP family)
MKEIFHVHTYRCKHASDESDEKLIQCAISLGAKKIVFTDHVPFPENPFRNRMEIEEIGEYLETLFALKHINPNFMGKSLKLTFQQHFNNIS